MTHKLLRVAAGVVVHGNQVLLVRRHATDVPEYDDKWELPAGKIESMETVTQAAIREIREETGYDAAPIRILPIDYQADLALTTPPLSVEVKCILCSLSADITSEDPPNPPRSGSHQMRWASFERIPYDHTIVGSREFLVWTANELGYPIPQGASIYRISLESVDVATNRMRSYDITLKYDPTISETPFRLELRTGRILGSSRPTVYFFPTMTEALQEARHRVRLRRRHGYTVTSLESTHPLRSWILSLGLTPVTASYPTLFTL
jgi:8-oxo-dGTP pyrophosphatase MutT (NUDIX family)